MSHLRAVTGALLLLLVCGPAQAQPEDRRRPADKLRESWKLFWVERAIENNMALGHLRGLLLAHPEKPRWTPRTAGKGRLVRGPGGVPILYLEGTPEEMGRQHGTLLRQEIRALRAYVAAFIGARRLVSASRDAVRLFQRHVPPGMMREIRALARAAGIPLDEILLAQWFSDIYRGFSCSALSTPSPEGVFLARNLDFPTQGYLQRYSVVVVARPAGKRPFVSVGWPGLVGVLSGQNDGLALAVLVVHGPTGVRSGLPFQLAFRRVLEECADTRQAEALLRRTPITVTNNLMIVDAAGRARVLELHPDGIVARTPEEGGRLIATNHFVTPERRQLRTSLTALSSHRRFRAVRRECPAAGPFSLATARRALAAAAVSYTVQSMIFLPREGAIDVAFCDKPPAAKRPYVRLRRELLLGRR